MNYISYVDIYKNSSYHPHWHDEFEAVYVKSGSIRVFVNSSEYVLKEGDGAFINCCVIHNYESAVKDTECVMPNVLFGAAAVSGYDEILHEKYIRPIITAPDFSHVIFRSDNEKERKCIDLIRQTIDLLEKLENGYEFKVRSLLSELIFEVSSAVQINVASAGEIFDPKLNMLRKMTDFIKSSFYMDIKVSDIAASAAIGVRECQRCFADIMSISPTKYLANVRIGHAKKLLRETTLSMLQICELCGYSDQSYFTKTFKDMAGCSPSQYRKKHKNMSQ